MQISGSSAIVVGGAGGLGEATVRRLHAAGAKVVIADLADEKGEALAKELDARYVRTDATNTEDVNAALAEAESLGPLRISVDAHGGPASGGRLIGKDGSPLDLDGFKTTIDVYLTARLQRPAALRCGDRAPGTARRGCSWRHHQHRVDRRLRGPDRPASVCGGQGRRCRYDSGRRSRPFPARHPRRHHRARHVPDAGIRQGGRPARGVLGPAGPLPQADGPVSRVRRTSCRASSKTITSTAKSSGWTARCASRRSSAAKASEREINGALRRRT